MRVVGALLALSTTVSAVVAPRQASQSSSASVTGATYDGTCFYPAPDPKFDLNAYLGTWYQVAGTPFGPTLGSRCVTANYQLNANGTVKVTNTAILGPFPISIVGTATPVDSAYGDKGVFSVAFPNTPPAECPGPNYIVQEYGGDWAIVQTEKWSTLYILSRARQPAAASIDSWVDRAVALGSKRSLIYKFDQSGCA